MLSQINLEIEESEKIMFMKEVAIIGLETVIAFVELIMESKEMTILYVDSIIKLMEMLTM